MIYVSNEITIPIGDRNIPAIFRIDGRNRAREGFRLDRGGVMGWEAIDDGKGFSSVPRAKQHAANYAHEAWAQQTLTPRGEGWHPAARDRSGRARSSRDLDVYDTLRGRVVQRFYGNDARERAVNDAAERNRRAMPNARYRYERFIVQPASRRDPPRTSRRARDNGKGPGGIPWPLDDRRWEVLRALRKPPIERRIPYPGDSVVYDRLYRELSDGKYIYWHRKNPDVSSLTDDHYRLTVRGKAALDDYTMMARGLAGTRRDGRDLRRRRA